MPRVYKNGSGRRPPREETKIPAGLSLAPAPEDRIAAEINRRLDRVEGIDAKVALGPQSVRLTVRRTLGWPGVASLKPVDRAVTADDAAAVEAILADAVERLLALGIFHRERE